MSGTEANAAPTAATAAAPLLGTTGITGTTGNPGPIGVIGDPGHPGPTGAALAAPATAAPADAKPVEGVPEKYDFKAPDGVTFDPAMLTVFEGQAKEWGLNNTQANHLIAFYAKGLAEQATAAENRHNSWMEQAKSDPEIGGKQLDSVLPVALKAINTFATPGFMALLRDEGLGNHPEVIRFAWKIGQAMGEDTTIRGNGPVSQRSIADLMYDKK